jgi:hypothetical protein
MLNHKQSIIEYNCDEILNVLRKYPRSVGDQLAIVSCSTLEILQISKILNFKESITSILYFRIDPKFSSLIHKDYYLISDLSYALNLPLFGCNNVSMKWFKQAHPNTGIVFFPGPSNGRATPSLSYENAICIDDINCNSPTIVKINDWHNITNHSTDTEAGLISIRFKDISVVPSVGIEPTSKS